ncbi:EamA-like transporter family protein [compost metagenome]
MMLKRMGSMRLAGLCGTASSLMVLAHYLVVAPVGQLWQLPGAVWANAGLMAVFSTVLPIYWVALAIQRLGPVLTVLASWAILSEEISLYQVVGLAVVLFAVSRLKPRGKQETTVAQPGAAPVGAALCRERAAEQPQQ